MMRNCFVDRETRSIADLVPSGEMGLPNGMIITRINVPKTSRGKGIGSVLLRTIIHSADENNQALYLEIQPSDGLDYDQLEAWYTRYGFKRDTKTGIYYKLPRKTI